MGRGSLDFLRPSKPKSGRKYPKHGKGGADCRLRKDPKTGRMRTICKSR